MRYSRGFFEFQSLAETTRGRVRSPLRLGRFALLTGLVLGCGGNPEVAHGNGSSGAPSTTGGTGNGSGGSSTGGVAVILPDGGAANPTEGGAGSTDESCASLRCDEGQHCEETNGIGSCVDSQCRDLDCKDTEECEELAGGGARCRSIACDADVDCPEARHCDGKKCVDDVCEPDVRTCDGNAVNLCSSNGGSNEAAYNCSSAGYFDSTCRDATADTSAGCSCEGDWDCPEFTVCEASACKGTGVAPTCTLPPARFEDVLPKLEFRWGGSSTTMPDATGKAFPWSAQVGSAPVVINLDDDNDDGLINELDFPEILFMSYYGSDADRHGTVRALHGGGQHKGEDYFALCGTTHWQEGEPIATDCNKADNDAQSQSAANARASGMLAAGDLDGDGVPEIVVPLETGGFHILDNRGQIIMTSAAGLWPAYSSTDADNHWRYPAPAIANVDFDGLSEIVVGNRVVTLTKSANGKLAIDRVFAGQATTGATHQNNLTEHHGPTVCVADLTTDKGLEIVAGTSVYRLPDVEDCAAAPNSDYCKNRLTTVWQGTVKNPTKTFTAEGSCAVADVLGADTAAAPGPGNPLDGVPEILIMSDGHLLFFKAADGTLLRDIALGGGDQGGAPNVDDFDGDGFPEVATALSDFYVVTDLQTQDATHCPAWNSLLRQGHESPDQNPARTPGGTCKKDGDCNAGAVCNTKAGQCVCLQSGWKRDTEDNSSKVTSSSVFDFNGDGAAEVVYNDECYFRVYDGASGKEYLQLPSLSRTIIENPVVADVDNDGNAEIVFVQNNETLQCKDEDDTSTNHANLNSWPDGVNDVPITSLPNGIEVWGDPSDVWVAARRVWNQHAYHVTNVTEGGQIPLHEPESWKPLNGRLYNTYRSQPRNYGVAPDLTLTAIQVSSPDVACGELSDQIEISVLVKNQGDLRVGPGVEIAFSGEWQKPGLTEDLKDSSDDPITVTLDKSLEPGASTIVTVSYEAGNNGRDDLPVEISAVVDAKEAERECHEDNNSITGPVEAGEKLADLRLEIDKAANCSMPKVDFTVYNDGAADAEDVVVRIYAGDPSQGGQVLGEITLPDPIAAGESESGTVTLDELTRNVTLYGIADPLDTVPECNDANNRTKGPLLECDVITR
jgi:hypothetical protein